MSTDINFDEYERDIESYLEREYDRYENELPTIRRFRITIEGEINSIDDRGSYGPRFERAAATATPDPELKYDVESAIADGAMWVTTLTSIDFLGQEVDKSDTAPVITSTFEPTPVVSGR